VESAERWGEEQFQPVPRRTFRFAVAKLPDIRRWAVQNQGLPAPTLVAAALQPAFAYYARTVEADGRRATEAGVRADLAALPAMFDRVDQLLTDGTLAVDPPNAATLQILITVRVLGAFADLREFVQSRPCAQRANELFARYPAEVPPFLDPAWLEPIRTAAPRNA
jgi:glutathione S-transferase